MRLESYGIDLEALKALVDNGRYIRPTSLDAGAVKFPIYPKARVAFDANQLPIGLSIDNDRLHDPAVRKNRVPQLVRRHRARTVLTTLWLHIQSQGDSVVVNLAFVVLQESANSWVVAIQFN
ncbi:MAG TPA: hypothetical protein VIY86_06625 [Pirellulaceae bacterium]